MISTFKLVEKAKKQMGNQMQRKQIFLKRDMETEKQQKRPNK